MTGNTIQGSWLKSEDGVTILIIIDTKGSIAGLREASEYLRDWIARYEPVFPVVLTFELDGEWTAVGEPPYHDEVSRTDPHDLHVETIVLENPGN